MEKSWSNSPRSMNYNVAKSIGAIALYGIMPVLANFMIGHIGIPTPNGPHVLPVWYGIMAPSGVYLAGLALVLRDLVQELAGRKAALIAILTGSLISYWIASPNIAIASGCAFIISELADFAVYTPLKARGSITVAILVSGIVGAIIDSALFLQIAYSSLDFFTGQVIGKFWANAIAAGIMGFLVRKKSTQPNRYMP